MLKICITNLSVESISNLGSINIGKTIISQNRSSTSQLVEPIPAQAEVIPGEIPAPGAPPVTPGEVAPPSVPPVSPGEVTPPVVHPVSPGEVGGIGDVGGVP